MKYSNQTLYASFITSLSSVRRRDSSFYSRYSTHCSPGWMFFWRRSGSTGLDEPAEAASLQLCPAWLLSVVLMRPAGVVALQACRGQQSDARPRFHETKEQKRERGRRRRRGGNMALPSTVARLCRSAGRTVTSLSARHRRAVSLSSGRCYTSTSSTNSESMWREA